MPIYLGTPKVKNIWLGTSKVKNIWAGLDKIYSIHSGRLPDEYQEVEYLANPTPGPTINTGLNGAIGKTITATAYTTNTGNNSYLYYIDSPNNYGLYYGKYGGIFGAILNFVGSFGNPISPITDFYTATLEISSSKLTLTGDIVGERNSTSQRNTTGSLMIFLGDATHGENALWKLKEMLIKENNILVRHYIPCYLKADTTKHTAGLYDLVTNTFYGNSGTGYFEVGRDIK